MYDMYTATPWQKGITDNFVKIELLQQVQSDNIYP